MHSMGVVNIYFDGLIVTKVNDVQLLFVWFLSFFLVSSAQV